jgi:2-dehydropantoate 2-reductase
MNALHIPVIDLPGTPVRLLVGVASKLPPSLSQPLLSRALGSGRGGKLPSFYIDLHNRRGQSEVDYLNGAVVRFGTKAGVATPVNRFLTATLLALTSGELPMETYEGKPEKLMANLKNYQTIVNGEENERS